jgi:drug/metabolite transporter (DMT)-like permease
VAPVIMARRLADLPPVPVVSASLLLVAAAYLPFGLAGMPTHVAAETVWSVVVLALVCTALAFVVFFALIAAIGPARATVITYVNPAVAVLLGVLLLNERLTTGMMIGFPLILAGSVLAARKPSGAREPAAPEGSVCEPISDDQSMRTGPWAVSNVAATSPAPASSSSSQETETPSSGWRADVPR